MATNRIFKLDDDYSLLIMMNYNLLNPLIIKLYGYYKHVKSETILNL